MTALTFANPAIARSPLKRGLAAFTDAVAVWEMRATTRRALAEVDPQRLPDLGLTVAQARAEMAKPFWVA